MPSGRSDNTGRKSAQSSMTYDAAESSISAAIVLPLHCLGEKFHHHFHHQTGCNMSFYAFRVVSKETEKTPETLDISRISGVFNLAAGEGFEPSQTESESVVLPLHNPAILFCLFASFASAGFIISEYCNLSSMIFNIFYFFLKGNFLPVFPVFHWGTCG